MPLLLPANTCMGGTAPFPQPPRLKLPAHDLMSANVGKSSWTRLPAGTNACMRMPASGNGCHRVPMFFASRAVRHVNSYARMPLPICACVKTHVCHCACMCLNVNPCENAILFVWLPLCTYQCACVCRRGDACAPTCAYVSLVLAKPGLGEAWSCLYTCLNADVDLPVRRCAATFLCSACV